MEDWRQRAATIHGFLVLEWKLVVIGVQTLLIVYLAANWSATREVLALGAENRQLRAAVTARTIETCQIQLKLGQAYGITLKQLLQQLGVDQPNSAAAMVLQAFNEGKMLPPVMDERTFGMGGGDGEPEVKTTAPPVPASSKAKTKPKR